MNVSSMLRTVNKAFNAFVPKLLSIETVTNVLHRNMNSVCGKQYLNVLPNTGISNTCQLGLLQPTIPLYNPVCGLKVKGRPHLRCKHCYFVWRRERLYVMCKDKPRHKQTLKTKKIYKTWLLTHAMQSPVRPW